MEINTKTEDTQQLRYTKPTPEQVQRANTALARAIAIAQQMVKNRENKRGDVL